MCPSSSGGEREESNVVWVREGSLTRSSVAVECKGDERASLVSTAGQAERGGLPRDDTASPVPLRAKQRGARQKEESQEENC